MDFDAPEFFLETLVKIDRAIDRDTAKSIRYELRVSGAMRKMPQLPATPMQTPGERTDHRAIVEVCRLDYEALKKVQKSSAPETMKEYLSASPPLNTKDEAIVRMAKEAAGEATRPFAVADKLRVYVSEAIREKNLNVGFATASEVCRKREGDCTEHAVLLAALGRARGIPSRVVVGLAYVPNLAGVQNVFGFHMWTQFHIGDQWVDFDAALGETDCSPARIALATSSLKDASIGDIAFAIMDVVRGLQIEIKSIESR
jgi:transglutaminase-like putative cysteine protease